MSRCPTSRKPADGGLVAGVDSSTQSCKVVVRDMVDGTLVRQGRAPHPGGTEAAPAAWERALHAAVADAGGLDDVAALSVAGQQHGMVCLDTAGAVVRPALLWNDTRSGPDAAELIAEYGAEFWAQAVGTLPVASLTLTKLRWLARNEPRHAAATAAVALPHDWLTWRLAGAPGLDALATDRSDASGTGYWSAATGRYRTDLVEAALGRGVRLPRVAGPSEAVGRTAAARSGDTAEAPSGLGAGGVLLGPGAGDNAAAALGLGARSGDVVLSLGTSGTACAVADQPTADPTGAVAGFADATGRHLPLVCTLNAARVLDATAHLLGTDLDGLAELALTAPPGADGLVLVPYLEGERTPARPDATGSLHGLTPASCTPAHLARAAVEGLLCGLADGIDALVAQGVPVSRVLLIGGGARSEAVRRIAPTVLGRPVVAPAPGEYVADGAARQAAWALAGGTEPPAWPTETGSVRYEADPAPHLRERYAAAREHVLDRVG